MSTIRETILEVSSFLETKGIEFALAGGVAASHYRDEIRTTNDVDLCVGVDAKGASSLLKELGYNPKLVTKGMLEGMPFPRRAKKTEPYIVVGARGKGESKNAPHIDLLLPSMPWVPGALKRAQHFKLSLDEKKTPILTVEDIIVAKLFSFHQSSNRFKDLDDLQSIFKAKRALDLEYLKSTLRELSIPIPKEIQKALPKELEQYAQAFDKRKRKGLSR